VPYRAYPHPPDMYLCALVLVSVLGWVCAEPAGALVLVSGAGGADRAAGDAHVFSVRAEGAAGTLHYQWRKDGVSIPGAVTETYVLDAVGPADAGMYRCIVSDDSGATAVSLEARLTVLSIAKPPEDAVCTPGQAHAFSVEVAGGGKKPLAYQWYKDGAAAAGATQARLALNPVRTEDRGVYQCEVRQGDTVLVSERAVLQVADSPIIFDEHPLPATVYRGDECRFEVAVSGGVPPFRYQWRHNDTDISGATEACYPIAAADAAHSGAYVCVVSDAEQSVPSRRAVLRVVDHLTVTAQPEGGLGYAGEAHTFRVAVSGGKAPVSYQWRLDGTDVPGAAASVLYLNPLARAHTGAYTCLVKDGDRESVLSAEAVLEVTEHVTVAVQPKGADRYEGQVHEFEITVAGGKGPFHIQWHRNDADIPGATGPRYAVGPLTVADAGTYACVVTDESGETVASEGTVLRVFPRVRIARHPVGGVRYVGDTCTFSVEGSGGTGELRYQWRRDSADLEAGTEPAYTIASLSHEDAGVYVCVVTDASGQAAESNGARLEVYDHVAVTVQPLGGDYFSGEAHTFSLSPSGGYGALRYQWRQDGQDIPGATSSTYTIDPLAPIHAGTYACVIRDSCTDSRTSEPAILTVLSR